MDSHVRQARLQTEETSLACFSLCENSRDLKKPGLHERLVGKQAASSHGG